MIRTLSFFMGVKRNFSLSCFSKDYKDTGLQFLTVIIQQPLYCEQNKIQFQ